MKPEWKPMSPHYDEAVMGKNEWLTVASVRGVFAWEVAIGTYTELGHIRCNGTVKTKSEAKIQAEHMYRVLKKEKTT